MSERKILKCNSTKYVQLCETYYLAIAEISFCANQTFGLEGKLTDVRTDAHYIMNRWEKGTSVMTDVLFAEL